jgi:hypothetical protein
MESSMASINLNHSNQHRSRRTVLKAAMLSGLGFATTSLRAADTASPKRSGLLVQSESIDLLATRSKIVLELAGELKIKEPDPSKEDRVRTAEVKGKSTLDYFEKIAFENQQPIAAARQYVTAKSENWVSGNASSQELRSECQETRLLLNSGTWQQYCATQPLDSREVELLHSPINTLALEQLLPHEPAKADQPWKIGTEAAKTLFNLDAVHASNLTATIVKVEKGVATTKLSGQLEATANSVTTKLDVQGSFQAKLGSQCAIVNWLGVVIKEEREISQAEPGFSITARINLIRTESNEGPAIAADELRALVKQQDDGRWLVRIRSNAGRYEMLADRRWTTYIDGGEEAILRLIENNTVIAQCNVTQLPQLDAGTQLTLEALQEEVKKSQGSAFREMLESAEQVTSSKLRLMRLVVAGELEEVPIQWIYNHLSDDAGRRMVMEFTMSAAYAARFAASDEQMSTSFAFLAAPAATDVPTPAAQLSSKPTKANR